MAENILVLDNPNELPVELEQVSEAEARDLALNLKDALPRLWDDMDAGAPTREPLFREVLGATLRDNRAHTGFTLRELAQLASVSPGYLSELERGRKEVSSELLASVCHAMGVSVASVILEAASMMTLDAAAAELSASMSVN